MSVAPSRIRTLLNPTSIAIIGASDESRWARGFVHNLTEFGPFPGRVYLVNPRRTTVLGRACYQSLADLPEPVDHAVVLVRAERVPDVVAQMGAAGVRAGTVIAAGFNEGDGRGRPLAAQVAALCAEHGIALIGPNCYGFNNYAGTIASNYPQLSQPLAGRIGCTTQSAAIGAAVADSAVARGIRLRYLVSTGNELVTDSNDYFEFFLESDDVAVFGGVLERIPDPDRFAVIATRALEAGKPIVVLKLGRSAAAVRIAVAHTGSVTGVDAIADAFLRDLGVIRVDSPEQWAETAGLLAERGWPGGRRTAYFGLSGGASELFAEEAEGTGLEVEPFGDDTRARLSQASGLDAAVIDNPFDMTADGGRENYGKIAEVLAADPAIDILVTQGAVKRSSIPDPQAAWRSAREAELMVIAERHHKYAVMLETGDHQPGIEAFPHRPAGGAYYLLGHTGVLSLGRVAGYGVRRAAILADPGPGPRPVDPPPELRPGPSGLLAEPAAKALLRAYGIPTTRDILVTDSAAAVLAAGQVGYPVVLKAAAEGLAHKSEIGGVLVGLRTADEVRAGFDRLMALAGAPGPGAGLIGVLVTHQADGAEFFAGIASDPDLGPVVVAGLGGIYVEALADRVLARPPLSHPQAEAMLAGLRSASVLNGTRGRPPLDLGSFADVLCRLSHLAVDFAGRITELDINPLFVRPVGHGVIAADALAVCPAPPN
jgi:acyl-CoA synthetase (NDP forming)